MVNYIQALFTESTFGSVGQDPAWAQARAGGSDTLDAPAAPSLVERLGFPGGTDPLLLAQVLVATRATAPAERTELLRRPGFLSRLFSPQAAEASYLGTILTIVESPFFEGTLNRLRSG